MRKLNLLKEKVGPVSSELTEIIKELNEKGYRNLYVDGGKTIQSFLNQNLIDEITISRIPIVLGNGIPLFSSNGTEMKLIHQKTDIYEIGIVKTHYRKLSVDSHNYETLKIAVR